MPRGRLGIGLHQALILGPGHRLMEVGLGFNLLVAAPWPLQRAHHQA